MHRKSGVPNPEPPTEPPPTFIGYADNGTPLFSAPCAPLESDPADKGQDYQFEKGTPAAVKLPTIAAGEQRLREQARAMPAGPTRDWTLRTAESARRQRGEIEREIGSVRRAPRRTGMQTRRPARPRAQTSRPSARSGDSGSSDDGPSDEPALAPALITGGRS